MISIDSKIEIYLYGGSTDMRKGIHGLAMLIEDKIGKKCGEEGLFVFRSKKGDRIKWYGGMVKDCACIINVWAKEDLHG